MESTSPKFINVEVLKHIACWLIFEKSVHLRLYARNAYQIFQGLALRDSQHGGCLPCVRACARVGVIVPALRIGQTIHLSSWRVFSSVLFGGCLADFERSWLISLVCSDFRSDPCVCNDARCTN